MIGRRRSGPLPQLAKSLPPGTAQPSLKDTNSELDPPKGRAPRESTCASQQLLDHQLLDRPADQRQIVDLRDLVSRVAADFAPLAIEAGYDLALEPPANKVHVEINVLQIERALANLIRNAIDHGGGSGTITIAVDETGGVEIRDEGPGIPADEHENVFEPFYRLQPQSRGAGLGLNLSRQIALLHGGTIRILAGPWQGARIRLELPVRSVTAGGGKNAGPMAAADAAGLSVF
nr:HAMP domain-containing sensor histidine kinase [Mesorhizobium sp.]